MIITLRSIIWIKTQTAYTVALEAVFSVKIMKRIDEAGTTDTSSILTGNLKLVAI
jgi:hypothetical protein